MTFTITILRRAQSDVDHIYDWLAARSPSGAVRWYAAFLDAVSTRTNNPYRFAPAPESCDLGIEVRERRFKTRRGRQYRLLFTIVGKEVRVLRIRGPGQAPVNESDVRP